MSDDNNKKSLLDSILRLFGMNPMRVRWKWRQRRFNLGEQSLKTEMAWRSAKAQHKMCPECRSLVPKGESKCPDCGTSLSKVSTPGLGRSLANLFPGLSAITGLILLVNGFVFWIIVSFLSDPQARIGAPLEFFFGQTFFFWLVLLFVTPVVTMRLLSEERRVAAALIAVA